MDEHDRRARRRPGAAFAGFAVSAVLLVVVVALFNSRALQGLGWQGGEYAWTYVGVAVGSVVAGLALRSSRPPWRSVGTGLIVGGVLGVVLVVALVVAFLLTFPELS